MVFTSPIFWRSAAAAAKSGKKVELYYDVISPYSWFGFELYMRYKPLWNTPIILKPFLVTGLFKVTGIEPAILAMNTPKKAHFMEDVKRGADYYDVPLNVGNLPDSIANGSLEAMRFITAVDMCLPEHLEDVSRAFAQRRWQHGKDISTEEGYIAVAQMAKLSSADTSLILEKMNSQPIKDRLKETTQFAADNGAFGVPTAFVTDEAGNHKVFFGADRINFVAKEVNEPWYGPIPSRPSEK